MDPPIYANEYIEFYESYSHLKKNFNIIWLLNPMARNEKAEKYG